MSAFGAVAESEVASFGITGSPATVSIPPDAAVSASMTPRVSTGARVSILVNGIVWTNNTPRPSAGSRSDIPVNAENFTGLTPRPSVGASIRLPIDTETSVDATPRVKTGVRVAVTNNFITNTNLGAVGDDAVAADAVLSGDSVPRSFDLPDDLGWISKLLSPRSGGSAVIPKDPLSETDKLIEIDARRRRLHVKVINS